MLTTDPRAIGHTAEPTPTTGRPALPSALQLWLLTRAATLFTVMAGAWLVTSGDHLRHPLGFTALWNRWDSAQYVEIARWGYGGSPTDPSSTPLESYFPGLPLLIRALHTLSGLDYVLSGLLISFVAGGIAVVALARIAALAAGPGTPADKLAERTVLLFLLGPSAIFLAAGYSESLFLAFALPAWLAAKRGHWWVAGLLAAGAGTTRFIGVFLGAALIVEFLTARDGRRRWREMPALGLAFLPILGYVGYLQHRGGNWTLGSVQHDTGGQVFAWPWDGLRHALWGAESGRYTADWAWMFRAEVVAALVGVALLIFLVRSRRWAEATFIGLQLAALTTTYWWMSIPRATLTWWPLWVVLAGFSLRRPAVYHAYLAVLAPFMVALTLAFTNGRWAG
jgi:hypothetical protein